MARHTHTYIYIYIKKKTFKINADVGLNKDYKQEMVTKFS